MADFSFDQFKQNITDLFKRSSDAAEADPSIAKQVAAANAEAWSNALHNAATWAKNGPLQSAKVLFNYTDPTTIPKSIEGTAELGLDLAKHVAGNVNALAQSVSPVDLNRIPGMSGVFPQASDTPGTRLDMAARNIPVISDFTYNPLMQLVDTFHKDIAHLNPDATVSQKIVAGYPAIRQTIGQVLSGPKQLMTGVDEEGLPLDARTASKALEQSLMLGGAGLGALGRIAKGGKFMEALEGEGVPKEATRVLSKGEIEAAQEIQVLRKQEQGRQLVKRNAAKVASQQLVQEAGLTPKEAEGIVTPDAVEPTVAPVEATVPPEGAAPLDPSQIPEAQKALAARIGPSEEEFQKAYDTLPPGWKAQGEVEKLLPLETLHAAHVSLLSDDTARSAFIDHLNQGDEVSKAAIKVLVDPEIMHPILSDIIDTRGASLEDARTALAGSYENTKQYFGKAGADFSQTMNAFMDQLDYTARTGNLDQASNAMKILKDLRYATELSSGRAVAGNPLGSWQKAATFLNKVERLRIGSILTPARTAFSIAQGQFGLVGTDFMDAAYTAMANGFRNKVAPTGAQPTSTDMFADLHGLSQSFINQLRPSNRLPEGWQPSDWHANPNNIEDVLNAAPRVGKSLMQGLLFDTEDHLFGQMSSLMRKAHEEGKALGPIGSDPYRGSIKKGLNYVKQHADFSMETKGKAAYNIGMGITDMFLLPNRWQETQFRKFAFDARYRANLETAGIGYGEALAELNRRSIVETADANGKKHFDVQEIRPELREALVDAQIHALRQTYAFTPEGGMFGALLRINREFTAKGIPTSMFAVTFPRAMVNNLLWQMHHSPVGIADLFTGEFRDAFMGLKDQMNPTTSRNASRKIGEALTGLTMMTMAMHMTNGGKLGSWQVGAKPWLWENPDEKDEHGNPKTFDASNLQPFNSYWTMADQLMSYATGRPSSVDPAEAATQLFNTNIADVPMFTWQESLRNLNSNQPDTKYSAFTKDIGRYLGGFTTIAKGWREEFAMLPPQFRSAAMMNGVNSLLGLDTKTGFARHYQHEALPDAMLGPLGQATLPKVDTATGMVDRELHPVLNVIKANRKGAAPFEKLLDSTPGYDLNNVVKHYEDPHATMLVRQAYGQLINEPEIRDFSEALLKLHTPMLTEQALKKMLPGLHQKAEKTAMLWDANADAEARKVPASQGRPVHFSKELADKVNTFGDPKVQHLLEQLIQKSPSVSPTP